MVIDIGNWLDHQTITLSEKSQSQKVMCCVIPFTARSLNDGIVQVYDPQPMARLQGEGGEGFLAVSSCNCIGLYS